jgi:Protein of unknown function (DUF433)
LPRPKQLVIEQRAYGWSPEELHFQHPHLTLGQIHSALAYYWDHHKELDRDIRRRLKRVEGLRREVQPSPLVERFIAQDQGNDPAALHKLAYSREIAVLHYGYNPRRRRGV